MKIIELFDLHNYNIISATNKVQTDAKVTYLMYVCMGIIHYLIYIISIISSAANKMETELKQSS